jgi:hypothetical protein
MTKVNKSSPSYTSKGYGTRSEDTTPAADTERNRVDTSRTSADPVRSQGAQATQGVQATQETSPSAQADYWKDSFAPAVASATPAADSAMPAVASAPASPVQAAAGSMSSASRGSGQEPEPIDQVGGVYGNGDQQNDLAYDGGIIDGEGNVYPPGTPVEGLTPTSPNNGQPANGTAYFINGIQNDANFQTTSMQSVANAVGTDVFGIHNATYGKGFGIIDDLVQCLTDKTPIAQDLLNDATTSLAGTITQDLAAGNPVHLIAHSQGALVTANALEQVKEALTEAHGAEKAEEMLSTVQVETFGGAAASFPYGPQYVHYLNDYDMVAMDTGLGTIEDPAERQAAAGGDRAAIHFIRDDPRQATPNRRFNFSAHDFNEGYLSHRLPFEEALANNSDLDGRTSPVQEGDGAPAHYAAPTNPAAELAERRATEAAANSAHALADVEAAVRSGDLAAAREAAARVEELAGVAQQASDSTPALVDSALQESNEAYQRAWDERERALQYTLLGLPAPEGLPPVPEADLNMAHVLEQQADLNTALRDSARAAEQARSHARRAAELVAALEQQGGL